MNRDQRCLITILEDHGGQLTTSQILELTGQYPDLCQGCSSGSQIISAGISLVQLGKIKREVAKGGFVWILI